MASEPVVQHTDLFDLAYWLAASAAGAAICPGLTRVQGGAAIGGLARGYGWEMLSGTADDATCVSKRCGWR